MGAKLTAAVVAGLVIATAARAVAAPAARAAAPAFSGREIFKIVTVKVDEPHPRVAASGAFTAGGYLVRRTGTAVFPRGRIQIRRHVTRISRSGPDLRTCRLRIRLDGRFEVVRATGRFRGLRERGRFSTTISATLARTGADSCSATVFVAYHAVTYEIGRADAAVAS